MPLWLKTGVFCAKFFVLRIFYLLALSMPLSRSKGAPTKTPFEVVIFNQLLSILHGNAKGSAAAAKLITKLPFASLAAPRGACPP